jgi:hypothetical protein
VKGLGGHRVAGRSFQRAARLDSPPLSLRPGTAAVWALIVGFTALAASVVRVAMPAWAGRIAMGVLIALGVTGAVLTV